MGDRLKPIVSPQLFIDVVQMIAQGLRTDSKSLGNLRSIVPRREHSQDLEFVR